MILRSLLLIGLATLAQRRASRCVWMACDLGALFSRRTGGFREFLDGRDYVVALHVD